MKQRGPTNINNTASQKKEEDRSQSILFVMYHSQAFANLRLSISGSCLAPLVRRLLQTSVVDSIVVSVFVVILVESGKC